MTLRVPLLDLKAQLAAIKPQIQTAIDRVVETQHFILGPEVEQLEREVAAYSRTQFAVGVSSGTDAILLALMALGVGAGDEVITTPQTFVATVTSIARLGARAKFVDIEPATFNLDPRRLEAAITPRTKAIIPVHLFGQMTDMDGVMSIADRHAIPVIEDAAQAIGAERGGHRAGSVGAMGSLSFFPSKNLGAFGDAGMVLANDEKLTLRMRLLRNQGQNPKYYSVEVGGNFRLDALQAAILRAKLPFLDGWTEARQRNAATYRKLFNAAGFGAAEARPDRENPITLPHAVENGRHIYNQFVIRADRREALRVHLADAGIATEIYYPQPMHLQACFSSWGYRAGDYPEAERAAEESLAIPIYPELTAVMQEAVVAEVARFYGRR
jgi:dTDP-4-amino-4,6-dideoxygalactose transaminase